MTPQATAAAPMPLALRVWRYRVFASTWLCYVGFYFCRKPYSIVKSRLGTELDFDTRQLGIIYAAYLIAYAAGQFVSSAIGPRYGPRVLLLSGMAVSIGCSVAFGFTEEVPWFVALMVLNGLAQAMGWSNCVGNMASWYHRGERGTVMGIWATNFQVGGVAANALASFVLQHYGYRYAFFTGAMVLMAVWVFFFFNQANRPEDKGLPAVDHPDDVAEEPAVRQGKHVRFAKGVWTTVLLVGGAYFGLKFIRYAIWSWAPFVLERNFHLKGDDAGYVSTLFDLCGIAGVIATGWMSDRWFKSRRAKVSFLMTVGVVASTVLLFSIGASSVTAFAVCISLVGFTLFGPDALLTGAAAMDIGSREGAVRAAGIISGLGSAGSVVQELVIAEMYKQNGGAIGPILGTLLGSAILAAACIAAMLWRNRRGLSDV